MPGKGKWEGGQTNVVLNDGGTVGEFQGDNFLSLFI